MKSAKSYYPLLFIISLTLIFIAWIGNSFETICVIAFAFSMFFLWLGIACLSVESQPWSWVFKIFLVGYCLRCIAFIIIWMQYNFLGSGPGEDPIAYVSSAIFMATHGIQDNWSLFYSRNPGYSVIITLLFKTFGSFPLLAVFLNISIGSYITIILYRLVKTITSDNTARIAAWLYACHLPAIVWSTVIYRETFLQLFIVTFLLGLVRIIYIRYTIFNFALLFISIIAMFYFRIDACLPMILIAIILIVIDGFKKRSILRSTLYLLIIISFSLFLVYYSYHITEKGFFFRGNTISAINNQGKKDIIDNIQSGSAMSIFLVTGPKRLVFSPIIFAYPLYSPFPTNFKGSIFEKSLTVSMSFEYLLLAFFWCGLINIIRNRRYEFSAIILLLGIFLIGIFIIANYGHSRAPVFLFQWLLLFLHMVFQNGIVCAI